MAYKICSIGRRKLKCAKTQVLHTRAFVLVEALVAAAILTTVLASANAAFLLSVRSGSQNTTEVQATYLAEEGLEAVRVMRDSAWSNISSQTSGTPFYLAFDGTAWSATTTDTMIDATFVNSTAGRADTRRSTSGARTRRRWRVDAASNQVTAEPRRGSKLLKPVRAAFSARPPLRRPWRARGRIAARR